MSLSPPLPARPFWREPALVFAIASGLAFVALGLRAVAIPLTTSGGFGLPVLGGTDALWVQVYGSRTMLLGVIAIALAAFGNIPALALLFGVGAALPFFDMALIIGQSGPGPILFRHAAYVVWLGIGALWLWRLHRQRSRAA